MKDMSAGMIDDGYVLGVLGGLGPRASAEFLKTIYEYSPHEREQHAPKVVLYSDPSIPDRTDALLSGSRAELLVRLTEVLYRLCGVPVSEVVICCVTAHALLGELPSELRGKIVSLVELALAETVERRERQLLVCTNGARRLEIFQRHELWERAHEFVALPDDEDQRAVHELIYRIKGNDPVSLHAPALESLLSKYGADSFIAGCTEIHLLSKYFAGPSGGGGRPGCVDPLTTVARLLNRRAGASRLVPEALPT
jgi:aspartate racemase